jgi:RND family efflux transporter MFP subunit
METCFALHSNATRRWIEHFCQVLLIAAAFLLLVSCEEKKAEAPPPPPDVDVAEVTQQDVPVYQQWVAQLNGDVNAQIVPKVQGYLLKRNYREGSLVKTGELLFEIDPRPFQASLDQAKADLATADANLSRTDTDVARDTPLAAQNAIPQKQLDNDLAAQAAAKSQVLAHKAAVDQAKLNLDWTNVYSPIDGIAGTATSQVGDLVGTTTKMTTVSTVNPIRAYFSIPEDTYLKFAPRISDALRGISSAPSLQVEYIQANDQPYPEKGKIILVNREITSQTGTIQFAADFANPDAILRPGGFGQVRIQTGMTKNAMVVPQRAVIEVQSIYQVAIVGSDGKVAFRPVKVGDKVGTNWVITEGLKPGEKVIAQGFQRVREGMTVNAKPYVETAAANGEGK